jgi:hypothetical protein
MTGSALGAAQHTPAEAHRPFETERECCALPAAAALAGPAGASMVCVWWCACKALMAQHFLPEEGPEITAPRWREGSGRQRVCEWGDDRNGAAVEWCCCCCCHKLGCSALLTAMSAHTCASVRYAYIADSPLPPALPFVCLRCQSQTSSSTATAQRGSHNTHRLAAHATPPASANHHQHVGAPPEDGAGVQGRGRPAARHPRPQPAR